MRSCWPGRFDLRGNTRARPSRSRGADQGPRRPAALLMMRAVRGVLPLGLRVVPGRRSAKEETVAETRDASTEEPRGQPVCRGLRDVLVARRRAASSKVWAPTPPGIVLKELARAGPAADAARAGVGRRRQRESGRGGGRRARRRERARRGDRDLPLELVRLARFSCGRRQGRADGVASNRRGPGRAPGGQAATALFLKTTGPRARRKIWCGPARAARTTTLRQRCRGCFSDAEEVPRPLAVGVVLAAEALATMREGTSARRETASRLYENGTLFIGRPGARASCMCKRPARNCRGLARTRRRGVKNIGRRRVAWSGIIDSLKAQHERAVLYFPASVG